QQLTGSKLRASKPKNIDLPSCAILGGNSRSAAAVEISCAHDVPIATLFEQAGLQDAFVQRENIDLPARWILGDELAVTILVEIGPRRDRPITIRSKNAPDELCPRVC